MHARATYDLRAPLADFLYEGPAAALLAEARSGWVVGAGRVGDRTCDHLVFRQPGIDWRIWIAHAARWTPAEPATTRPERGGVG